MIRPLSYVVGKSYVFAFGGGTLFALDPRTGKLIWRHSVSNDSVIKKNAVSIEEAEMLEGAHGIYLISGNALARFDPTSMSTVAVLRKNLYEGPLLIVIDGALYCFTQRH
jgi:outer membrane protein assembly factor BamB